VVVALVVVMVVAVYDNDTMVVEEGGRHSTRGADETDAGEAEETQIVTFCRGLMLFSVVELE